MKTLVLALAAAALAATPAQAANQKSPYVEKLQSEAETNCEAEWPVDSQMQLECLKQELRSIIGASELVNTGKPYVEEIFYACQLESPGLATGVNWQMTFYCMVQQIKAYKRRLHPAEPEARPQRPGLRL
jgi:hypothetical protein